MTKTFTKALIYFIAFLATLSTLYGILEKNIHTVIPNQVYRSAQLSPIVLAVLAKKYHIQSIINLRGENKQAIWYRAEIKTAALLRIQHHDIALSSQHFPSPTQLHTLADLIETTPKPLLIHCRSGADRTGLASGMTFALLTDQPIEAMLRQCSWIYLVSSARSVGKQVFIAYQQWLLKNDMRTSPQQFKHWVQ